jgi:hypothetical protein
MERPGSPCSDGPVIPRYSESLGAELLVQVRRYLLTLLYEEINREIFENAVYSF